MNIDINSIINWVVENPGNWIGNLFGVSNEIGAIILVIVLIIVGYFMFSKDKR